MNYVIEFEIAAVMILILIITMYHVRRNKVCENNAIFAVMLYLELVCSIANIMTVCLMRYFEAAPVWVDYLVNIIYLLTYNISSVVVFYYVTKSVGTKRQISIGKKMSCIYVTIISALIIPTFMTGLIISFNDGEYQHGQGMFLLYILSVSLLLMVLYVLLSNRKNINKLQFGVMIALNIITISSIVLQLIFSRLLLQNFAISLSYCMLYITLQNPEDYMDKITGCRNRKSFYKVLEKRADKGEGISIVGFSLENCDHIQSMFGYEEILRALNKISMFLMERFGAEHVFHVDEEQYVITIESVKHRACESIIKSYFAKPVLIEDFEWNFHPHFFEVKDKKLSLDEGKEILERVFFFLEKKNLSDVFVLDDDIIDKIKNEKNLVRQLKNAIKDKSFDVFYQPIYHINGKNFKSAEALVRFCDEDGKFVSPEYFIPLAEKSGLILDIGEIVIEKVCRFIKEEKEAENFEYIEINLSTVQCVQEDLPKLIKSYTDEYGIAPSRLNFEITETAGILNTDILMKNMNLMCREGYAFSIDDYGTGFSTALYLTRMPVDIVKIDKSILWSAMKDSKAMSILESMVNMIQSIGKKVLVEGIETKEMAEILIKLECDYLQGFLYSKPLPRQEILKFLKNEME